VKKRICFLTLILITFLAVPLPVNSQIVGWSDNFNNGNLDAWTVDGWNATELPATAIDGNFSLDDNTLRATGEETSRAYRPSNGIYGTWEFDVDCVDTEINHFYIAFVSATPTDINSPPAEYGIMVVTGAFASWDNDFVFYQRNVGSISIIPVAVYDAATVSGWHSIHITRSLEGNFTVAFNGTIQMEFVLGTYSSSDVFSFYTRAGPALDNIVLTPYMEPSTTPSTTPDVGPIDPTLLLIAGGGIAAIVVIAVVIRSKK
jgi:hypothetical protein